MAKREIKCSNCGGKGHNVRSCKKGPPKETRHLMQHEVIAGGTYWAPYGNKGWSAVQIISKGYKHARVARVRPKTQEVINRKGKVRLDELLRREPKVAGADRPKETPEEIFGVFRAQRKESEEKVKQEKQVEEAPVETVETAVEPERTPEEEAERQKKLQAIFDLLDDGSTTDDW
jgi:hypothetical protein